MKKRSPKNTAFPDDGPWLEDDLVVWRLRKNQFCAMCKTPLKKQRRDLASMVQSANRWYPTCLQCLHIDHLVFLPAGDSRVTRMASRLSSRRAVVMTTRHKTLRREGILVEVAALRAACEKYDIELPPDLKEPAPEVTSTTSPKPTILTTPEPPRPTPQRATRRDTSRNYRFYETPTPKAAEKPRPDAATKPVAVSAPPSKAIKPAKTADNAYTQALSERIQARYPRSPDTMVKDIVQFALQVYLPQHAENAQLPAAEDVDLGPLLTAFLRR